jgi:hypothetical protein
MESVEAKCSECGVTHVVIPPTIGLGNDPAGETSRAGLPDAEGAHLVEASRYGIWSCKQCGAASNYTPEFDSS